MVSSLTLMLRWVALSICFIVFAVELDVASSSDDGLCNASAKILQGYECNEFHVTTKDGFILSIIRIPQGRSGSGSAKTRPPVLLQHGITADGMSWMVSTPEESLALVLADSGFDVWISNGRGTRFSLGHQSLSSTQLEYWDWSWDEIAQYDMPAFLDLVYQQTGQKVHYVGHSMGTLTILAALSEGMLLDRVASASLLCPIAYMSGILTSNFLLGEMGHNCCLNMTALLEYVNNNGIQPTSIKCLAHFNQTSTSGALTKYDYGFPLLNMEHYGQPTPPVYDLKNISKSLPLFLSYGGQDDLAVVTDVQHLMKDLSSHDPAKINTSFIKEYGHIDYIAAYNAREKVYNTIIDFLKAQSS